MLLGGMLFRLKPVDQLFCCNVSSSINSSRGGSVSFFVLLCCSVLCCIMLISVCLSLAHLEVYRAIFTKQDG